MLKLFWLFLLISCNSQFELEDQFKKYDSLKPRCQKYKEEVTSPLLNLDLPKVDLIEHMNPNLTNVREYLSLKFKLFQWLKKHKNIAEYERWEQRLTICYPIEDELKILKKLKKIIVSEKNEKSQLVMRKVYEHLVYYHAIKNPDPKHLIFVIEMFLELKDEGHFKNIDATKVFKLSKKIKKIEKYQDQEPALNLDQYISNTDKMYALSKDFKNQLMKLFKKNKKS